MSKIVPLLVLNGSVGSGKTTIGRAISGLLAHAAMPHAFVDRDALAVSWPVRGRFNEDLANLNLGAVWRNFRTVGADRLIVAGVVETPDEVDALRRAVPGAAIVLCRLLASAMERETRLRAREHGASRDWHLARSMELEAILDRATLEHFSIVNEGRPPDAVAREVLARTAWL